MFLVGKQGFRTVQSTYLEFGEPWQSLEIPKSYHFSSKMCIVLPNITQKEKNSINWRASHKEKRKERTDLPQLMPARCSAVVLAGAAINWPPSGQTMGKTKNGPARPAHLWPAQVKISKPISDQTTENLKNLPCKLFLFRKLGTTFIIISFHIRQPYCY